MNDFTVKWRNEAHSSFLENLMRNLPFFVLKPLRPAQAFNSLFGGLGLSKCGKTPVRRQE
jgi:hypothetical protein